MIRQRDDRLRHVATLIDREQIGRHKLIRANPLTCPFVIDGRASVSVACTTCGGTGYNNGVRGTDLTMAGPPYNMIYFIAGDIQLGHGLLGAGGRTEYATADTGSEILGDATFYVIPNQREPQTGAIIIPQVMLPTPDRQHPRPDRIIRVSDGQVFTVLHELEEAIGSGAFHKAFSLGIGFQAAGMPGVSR